MHHFAPVSNTNNQYNKRAKQRSECLKVRKKTATGIVTVKNQYNLIAVYPSFIRPEKMLIMFICWISDGQLSALHDMLSTIVKYDAYNMAHDYETGKKQLGWFQKLTSLLIASETRYFKLHNTKRNVHVVHVLLETYNQKTMLVQKVWFINWFKLLFFWQNVLELCHGWSYIHE